MTKRVNKFVACVRNEGYEASLGLRKIYQTISDISAERHELVKVIDESGEDYLYPRNFFLPIKLPKAMEKALFAAEAPALKSLHGSLSNLGPTPSAEDIETVRREMFQNVPRTDIA